jgi:endonuclease/exonuclease/phosphatase family metal-dependent hydrolase
MEVTVGTFNLNNLFSRYNFRGEIREVRAGNTEVDSAVEYTFTDAETYRIRTYMGRLVRGKPPRQRTMVADRIRNMDLDVLAVQEVEDIDTLKRFARDDLGGLYRYQVLVEGNDPRLIDLGVLSKFPIGCITSWQQAVHPDDVNTPVFGRDLLEVEILNPARSRKLFTLYNNHLKSHCVPYDQDQVAGARAANRRRRRQAETIARIVEGRMRPNSRFVVLGDMNDPPNSRPLRPLVRSAALNLTNALAQAQESRPLTRDPSGPGTAVWTHRYKPSNQPAEYELYDQIWTSAALANRQIESWIDRRSNLTGDGSDHDPAWIRLDL